MPSLNQIVLLVLRIGEWSTLHIAVPLIFNHQSDLFLLTLLAGLAILAMMVWRSWTVDGRRLVLRNPGRYHFLHQGWWPALLIMSWSFALIGFGPLMMKAMVNPPWWIYPAGLSISRGLTVAGVGSLFLVLGGLYLLRRTMREKVWYGQHGSAHWAHRGNMRIAPQKGNATVGTWKWVIPIRVHFRGKMRTWTTGAGLTAIALEIEAIMRHLLLIGSTGSAKGVGVFAPIIASSRQPFILQDVKSECQGMGDLRRINGGQEPIRYGCAAEGGWPSMRWNPLHEARTDPSPIDACGALAATLAPKAGNQNDFIQALAADVLAFIFVYSDLQTLGDIGGRIEEDGLVPVLTTLGASAGLLGRVQAKNMEGWTTDTIKGALSPFCSGWGRDVTSGHDFSLDDLITRGGYILSAEPIPALALPVRVIWGLLIRRMLKSNRYLGLTLLFDEAVAAGKIPDVVNALVTLRSKGVSIVFGAQHTAGILSVYGPQEGKALIDSFVNSIYLLSGLNPDDQRALVQQLGKATVIEKQRQGAIKRHVQVGTDLLTIEDVERRGKLRRVFWAVVRGDGLTHSGAPVIGKLTGSAGAGMVRHPSQEELAEAREALARIPQPSPYVPPTRPERATRESADLLADGGGEGFGHDVVEPLDYPDFGEDV